MNNSETKIKYISVFSNIIGGISSIITITQFVFAYKTGIILNYILAVLFIIIFVLFIRHHNSISENVLKYIMNLTCPDKMYKLKQKEVIYEFCSLEKMRHEKTFTVEVLHDGFIEINDKFKWTGDGELEPKAIEDNQEIVILDRKFGMQRYQIKFKNEKRYSKHDLVPVMRMQINNIQDPEHKSSLHLSSGVFEITDCLILHLVFDKNLKPKNIRLLEYLHYSDDEHYRCYDGQWTFNSQTDKKEIIWEIDKPFYGGKYMIDWDWDV